MKTLNRFILERLKLTKNSKLQKQQYNFFPKDFDELRSLLEQLLEERGPNANLNDIDVSDITTFYDENEDLGLFENLDLHNIDISQWNVNNVTDMVGTFYGCENFNCDLSNWNVSNIEDMNRMFYSCKSFKGQGLENWDVSKVKDMYGMFCFDKEFDCDLSKWNVSNVKDMRYMFDGCTSFKNKPSWYEE